MLTIWHNPRCRKSRETLALLENAGKAITIRLYLEDMPSELEIREILKQLGFDDPRELMRRSESTYKELGLKTETDPAILVKSMSDSLSSLRGQWLQMGTKRAWPPAGGSKSAVLVHFSPIKARSEISFH